MGLNQAWKYDDFLKKISNKLIRDEEYLVPWENIQREFDLTWKGFVDDILRETNYNNFRIREGRLLVIGLQWKNLPFGRRKLIPVRNVIILWN